MKGLGLFLIVFSGIAVLLLKETLLLWVGIFIVGFSIYVWFDK